MADIDLFSLAKIISYSASDLVGYYFAHVNKSRYPQYYLLIREESYYELNCDSKYPRKAIFGIRESKYPRVP